MKVLGQAAIQAFEKRGIGAETVVKYGVYSAARSSDGQVVPDSHGNIVVFPTFERGQLVNEKFRAPGKKFWQSSGGRRTFWNADALDDPNLTTGQLPLVVTEGEVDCLSAIECGFPLSVSVPDGAPPVPNGKKPDELEPIPDDDQSGKFAYLWNNRERLKRIKRFILAVDNDEPGQRLAAELVRRLSAARCLFVSYPDGCKDLNDVLQRHGPSMVATVLNGAKPYPVRGLYKLSDYPEARSIPAVSTGWELLDRHLKPFPGEFMVISGIPGMGKSIFMLNLISNLAHLHSWPAVVFSPEMPAVPVIRDKLRRICNGNGWARPDHFINEYFRFIDSDPTGDHDQDFDLAWIIDKATDAVLRDGIRILLIDPWNEVEHARGKYESGTDYIGRSIRSLKRFARLYDVAVAVICHPTKDVHSRDGKSRLPSLYDCEGSSHWFNKADHGVIIDRPNLYADEAAIHIKKVRFDETGERGEVRMRYDRPSCRFLPLMDEQPGFV